MILTDDQRETILDASLDDSTKIIRYLKEQEQKQKKYNLVMLIFTVISAVGAIIAAVTGIMMFFQ